MRSGAGIRRAARLAVLTALIAVVVAVPARAQTSASFPDLSEAPPSPSAPPSYPPPEAPPPVAVAPPAPAAFPAPLTPPPASMPPDGPGLGPGELGVWSPPAAASPATIPDLLPYRRGLPVPPGYHLRYRPATGLLVGGGTTFGIGYLVALATSSGEDRGEKDGALVIPVVGPFIALSAKQKNPCSLNVPPTTDPSAIAATQTEVKKCVRQALDAAARLAFIAADGAIQAFGAALLVAGAAGGRRELERDGVERVRVSPTAFGGEGTGLSVRVAF